MMATAQELSDEWKRGDGRHKIMGQLIAVHAPLPILGLAYILLFRYGSREGGDIFPAQVTLAADCGLKERQMRNIIGKAKRYGLEITKEWLRKDKCRSYYSWDEVLDPCHVTSRDPEVRQDIAKPTGNMLPKVPAINCRLTTKNLTTKVEPSASKDAPLVDAPQGGEAKGSPQAGSPLPSSRPSGEARPQAGYQEGPRPAAEPPSFVQAPQGARPVVFDVGSLGLGSMGVPRAPLVGASVWTSKLMVQPPPDEAQDRRDRRAKAIWDDWGAGRITDEEAEHRLKVLQ